MQTKETEDESIKDKFRVLCKSALERGEYLKKVLSTGDFPPFPEGWFQNPSSVTIVLVPKDELVCEGIPRDDRTTDDSALSDQPGVPLAGSSDLTPIELEILAFTSKINKLSVVPFLKSGKAADYEDA